MVYKTLGRTTTQVSAIGLGCSGIGGALKRDASRDAEFLWALRRGIELGMTFIDTAELYGEGHSEELIGRAVEGIRSRLCIATKVAAEHCAYDAVLRAAEGSLRRLKTDWIDLYQVHWPNPKVPVEATMRAMAQLVQDGKVRHIGVSNFSLKELRAAQAALPKRAIVSLQAEYNFSDRTAEERVLPYCAREGLSFIAYSPLDQGRISTGDERLRQLQEVAARYGKTEAQVALRWLISHEPVVAIPKAASARHLRENAEAADFALSPEDFETIDRIFTRPCVQVPTQRIRVVTQTNHPAYRTLEEAKANSLGMVPSPMDLAEDIRSGEVLKPVRVAPTVDSSGAYDYDLIEGRLRYWAWVIAYEGKVPIPVFVREEPAAQMTSMAHARAT